MTRRLLGTIGFILALRYFLTIPFRVEQNSMNPTLLSGDLVIGVHPLLLSPKAGDVVILRRPDSSEVVIKRIHAISTLGYWVRGDNADLSIDSREFGWVPRSALIARAYGVLVSFELPGFAWRAERFLLAIPKQSRQN